MYSGVRQLVNVLRLLKCRQTGGTGGIDSVLGYDAAWTDGIICGN